jgi:hypothetical protein
MLLEIALTVALSVETLSTAELEKYYWDCDTAFMKGEMGGQDMNSCLAVTEQFQAQVFNNDKKAFTLYWNKNKNREWERRGFVSKKHI